MLELFDHDCEPAQFIVGQQPAVDLIPLFLPLVSFLRLVCGRVSVARACLEVVFFAGLRHWRQIFKLV